MRGENMKIVVNSMKRKTSIARAVVKEGKGRVRVNRVSIEIYEPKIARLKILDPLRLAADVVKNLDISVKVKGGGWVSQAEAARMAVASGLVKFTESEELRRKFIDEDRYMLAGDPRRTEPKKWGGRSARAKVQKSYR
ncbi:MAG: 30S ribosomal protein S9 [Candidatus Wukongarchaeota archaeon]|jgi:small subunit ribosomal protein S9|nr:30S ribosomal protein S9 [Candidatus Wukongarchaeota archaeon]MDO8129039.1 30S ribosomal protein S9 [Candidatus Wukongarchaeota archaeon]